MPLFANKNAKNTPASKDDASASVSEEEASYKKRKLARRRERERSRREEVHSIDSERTDEMGGPGHVTFAGIHDSIDSIEDMSLPSDNSSVSTGEIL